MVRLSCAPTQRGPTRAGGTLQAPEPFTPHRAFAHQYSRAEMKRRTIARPVSLEGIGLHLGEACRLTFLPASSGTGIVFRRKDLLGAPTIRARASQAVLTERHTQLGEDPVSVHTVEHVLAAVAGCGIDDIEVELNAGEPPIIDGSAAPFVEALTSAGLVEHSGEVRYLTVRRTLTFTDGESTYTVCPASELEL